MSDLQTLHRGHSRNFENFKFIYPVLSRRSRGISIGVNLNPDKVCNFDCVYCQVDRRSQAESKFVETERLLAELDSMLDYAASGEIFREGKFASTPADRKRINDIAFAGDGEPTTYRNFDEIVAAAAALKQKHGLNDVKLVLITNASMLHRPAVARALEILDANQGEVWAKLEAGTPEYFQRVDRTPIPFRQILDNITSAARVRPIVIQALFMRLHGDPPSVEELTAWCERLRDIRAAGGQIRLVQVYTVARRPAEDFVGALTDTELEEIATSVRDLGMAAEVFGAA